MSLPQSDFDKIIYIKKDYLLLKRIMYKTKNLYQRHKHHQYLNKLCRLLKKNFKLEKQIKKKKEEKGNEDKSFKYELTFEKKDLQHSIDIILQLGEIINRMLKLKLYPSYSLIILGIISRLYFILNYFIKL